MHEQEVLRVGFQTNLIRYPRRHRYSRDTCRANEGVDGILGHSVPQPGHQNTCSRSATESYQTQNYNAQRLHVEETGCTKLGAHTEPQTNGPTAEQCMLTGVA